MQSIDVTCEWNDVALLTDQRAYTFICKTLLQIPEQTVETVQEILLADWRYQPEQNEQSQFVGSMVLQIGYSNAEHNRAELRAEIPLQGELQEPLTEQSHGRLIYSGGKAAGDRLLLETALQIPREQTLQRSQVVLGAFTMEERLELPEQWPDFQEVLATAAALQIDRCSIAQGELHLQGQYHLAVVYENAEQPGEALFAYEQRRPMEASLAVPAGLQALEQVQPYYQQLTAQLLDNRQILLAGDGIFCTVAVPEQTEQHARAEARQATSQAERASSQKDSGQFGRQTAEILQKLMEELQRYTAQSQTERSQMEPSQAELSQADLTGKAEASQNAADKQVEGAAAEQDCGEVCPVRATSQAHSTSPSVVNSRGSRRAHLSKYMRNLNSMVQTPKSIHNFELTAQPEQAEPTEEEPSEL